MLDPSNIPEVDQQELLSRFILSRRHFSKQTEQLKANAFMPPPDHELSVTRHRDATDAEVWSVGLDVASAREKPLLGRGDVVSATYINQKLRVVAAPVEGNPNHVNVAGWPTDNKEAQKLIALEIAAVAKFVVPPDS